MLNYKSLIWANNSLIGHNREASIREAGEALEAALANEEDPEIEEALGEISTKDHPHMSSPTPLSSISQRTTLSLSAPI